MVESGKENVQRVLHKVAHDLWVSIFHCLLEAISIFILLLYTFLKYNYYINRLLTTTDAK